MKSQVSWDLYDENGDKIEMLGSKSSMNMETIIKEQTSKEIKNKEFLLPGARKAVFYLGLKNHFENFYQSWIKWQEYELNKKKNENKQEEGENEEVVF